MYQLTQKYFYVCQNISSTLTKIFLCIENSSATPHKHYTLLSYFPFQSQAPERGVEQGSAKEDISQTPRLIEASYLVTLHKKYYPSPTLTLARPDPT